VCGIAGILDGSGRRPPRREELAAMAASLSHRGPDGFGLRLDECVGLAHARLSIIDLAGGAQPMSNEDGRVWITYNGEVYNFVELRPELEAAGHVFRTRSDTEVLVHAYEEWGEGFVERLNGNFAFAIWDERDDSLLLGRDRLGIRPLYWTAHEGRIVFGSELRALRAAGVPAEIDPCGLDQVFVLWATVAPRTILRDVFELPPGHVLRVRRGGEPRVTRFWDIPRAAPDEIVRDERAAAEELRALLEDSVRLRLRADVVVGAYLSGGLDSTAATALVREITDTPLETYSIAFTDREYDESDEQADAVRALGTEHNRVEVDYEAIARAFPDAVLHAEKPILRTAPVPLFLLAGLVREHGRKVVLTGEGADEVFGGYDIFKETKIRAWWARRPDSTMRPALLRKLYPFAPGASSRAHAFFEAFYRAGIDHPDDPGFSHRPTWTNGARNRAFYGASQREAVREYDPPADVLAAFAPALRGRSPLERAEYLETKIFLAGHLLASQGDRMSMGRSVEGRYPFLDHRIVELGARLAPSLKLFGLREKWVLRRSVDDLLPRSVIDRHKRPYIAPNVRSFLDGFGRELAEDLLGEASLRDTGLFEPARARQLMAKAASGKPLGERETMAFIGMLSTQILAREWSRPPRIEASSLDPASFPLRDPVGRG
jgi:asparagine synthase (glutamine-hydrolysing)